MSNYTKIQKHPQTGVYELAEFCDDYFGPDVYGVYFKSDDKTYPVEMVESKQIYDFWKDDVLNALHVFLSLSNIDFTTQEIELRFLRLIEKEYVKRWKKDPLTGNGATTKSAVLKYND